MNLELIPLTPEDSAISDLENIHNTPSVAKYVSVSDRYFDYVTTTPGVVYYKILADGVLTGGIHCEKDGSTMHLSICVAESHRRCGIAEAALRRVLLTVPDDVCVMEVSIDNTNIPSLMLFQKLGFIRSAQEDELITYRLPVNGVLQ